MQVNYGLAGNFFAQSYNEDYSPSYYHKYFYNKKFLGTVAGISADYRINHNSFVLAEYNRSVNTGEKNYFNDANGTEISIRDFKLRYINNSFLLGYGRDIKMNKFNLKPEAGIVEVYTSDQDIRMESYNSISIEESNFKNDHSVEGGVFLGLGCTRKIDTKFDIGIKARAYYLISIRYLEFVSLTPTLTYHFQRKLKSNRSSHIL